MKLNLFGTLLVLSVTTSTGFSQTLQSELGRMWGLSNSGSEQTFDLNPMQTFRLQAVAGQDIQRLSPIKGREIKVAVIDTGIDKTHPFLQGRIALRSAECSNTDATVDADGNMYPADCSGWSILGEATTNNVIGTGQFSDSIGHGTHVAGIVAAVSPNAVIVPIQVISESDQFKFTPIKPFSIDLRSKFDLSPSEDQRGGFDSSNPTLADRIARAIIYAVHNKVDVINLSLGWPQGSDAEIMRAAIQQAQAQGIIIVAASGNDSTSALLRPCQYEGVICVAAHNPDGSLSSFSNYGFGVDIAAPGASILSAVPMEFSSVKVPGAFGMDVMSGTSQAAPFVAGVVAEMLSRGLKPSEIYPRLILGARPVAKALPVKMGPLHMPGAELKTTPSQKFVLSGLLDMKRSMAVKEQPLILNAEKEIVEIPWDKKSKDLKAVLPLKNFWKSVRQQKISVEVVPETSLKVFPKVTSVQLAGDQNQWSSQDVKNLTLNLQIVDAVNPAQSRIPSEMGFIVKVKLDGVLHRQILFKTEVVLTLAKDQKDSDLTMLPIQGQRSRGSKLFLVDEIYDGRIENRDYLSLSQEAKGFSISLLQQNGTSFKALPAQMISFKGEIQKTRPHSRIRMDIDGDGVSEYILGLQEFKELDSQYGSTDYVMHFFIFDQNLNLKKQASFYDSRALIPLDYSWIKVGSELRPAWVGLGQPVQKSMDIMDLWQTDEDEPVAKVQDDLHFYYLDENFKLAEVASAPGTRIVDLIHTSNEQVQSGVIPVLVAKNGGTEIKPSYVNQFSMGWIRDQKLVQLQAIQALSPENNYRNLIDTRKDKALSLVTDDNEFRGTFWFGFDAHQKQRITTLDFKTMQFQDQLVDSQIQYFDAPLRIRSAYLGQKRKGLFLITNTEIEYHDLLSKKSVSTSLNKYTFFGDDLIVDLQFPLTIADQQSSKEKYPALFTTEGSGLSKGIRIMMPYFDNAGNPVSMLTPARLRLKAPQGCKSLDYPVYLGHGYAMDYDCGTGILRMSLKY